eukprot:9496094-Pyramimonas_sp.AAC.1
MQVSGMPNASYPKKILLETYIFMGAWLTTVAPSCTPQDWPLPTRLSVGPGTPRTSRRCRWRRTR